MKKILILMLVLSLALMFIGCSDDDDDNTPAATKVAFKNHTNAGINVTIDGIDETLVAGENWSYTLDNAIFGDDDVLNLNYDVSGMYIETATKPVTIEKNKTTNVDVISEGGIVVLKNNHYLSFSSAVIYPANGAPTGNNIIPNGLASGDSVYVLKDAADYRVSITLENGAYEAVDTFTLVDNQMINTNVTAQKILGVENQTNGSVTFRLDGGSINNLSANQSQEFILGDTYGLQVEASYNGLYIFAGTDTYDFFQATAYDVVVTADGGAIFIVNNTSANITEVYIAPSIDTEWGPDYMSGSIGAGQDYAWTVEAGSWDIRLVDDEGYSAEIMNVSVTNNQSEYIDYSEKAKTRATSTNLKNKAHYNYPVGGTRVEGN